MGFRIKLNGTEDVKKLVGVAGRYTEDIDLSIDRYVVDCASVLGIYSLDLRRYLQVTFIGTKERELSFKSELLASDIFAEV